MALPHQITFRNRAYTVVDDLTIVYRALITGMVSDEITVKPPQGYFTVKVDGANGIKREDLHCKTQHGGMFCISGYPQIAFPNLGTASDSVKLVVIADGYRKVERIVQIPQNTHFPVSLSDPIKLRRLPIRIQGRVVDTSNRNPIANARIRSVDDPNPSQPLTEHFVTLRSPLYFDHAAGVTVREIQLTAAGSPKQLAVEALGGTRTLTLNNRIGLAVDDTLRIGPDIKEEYGIIESLASTPADPNQPGEVTIRNRMNHTHPATTQVQRVSQGAIGTTRQLTREADAGDGVLVLNDVLNVETIEIVEPTAELIEYHSLGALTNDHGFYRLNGIGRVRSVHLDASATGFQPLQKPVAWTINYGQPVNVINFSLEI